MKLGFSHAVTVVYVLVGTVGFALYWVIYKHVQFSDMNSKIDSVKRGRGVGVIAMKKSFRGGPVRNNTL